MLQLRGCFPDPGARLPVRCHFPGATGRDQEVTFRELPAGDQYGTGCRVRDELRYFWLCRKHSILIMTLSGVLRVIGPETGEEPSGSSTSAVEERWCVLLLLQVLLNLSDPATRASPCCDSAVLPVHNRGEISRTGNSEASQCAPAPNGGRVGARGFYHHNEKRISTEQYF
jgi:hypothetical protein